MYSLWKQQKDGNPCYRILLYCGVMDFGILWSLGILAPILSLNGSIFCTDPLITFITGATNDFFYSCEMIAGVLLALNRCLDILCTEITQMLFDGNKVWIWLGIITIYGLYWLLFINHGISPFIFLCINRTVRNDCILLFYKIYDPSRITQAHGITVLRSVGGGVPIQSGSQRSAAVTKVSPGILPPVVGNRERDRF
ncbi:hypothetical protein Mgra_00005672 [Meloidogyne graminicola]|uniref:Uncharacterized protein n=1 Tax=Meloidogyne graminicola TaxID=189291 RepID=A0A8S9ZP53_9BILA|nr:hypothetical protein Mgra_00005672 [Meloidogyne graminicola]